MERSIVKKPNFFIVGAPKCGTTAMQYYLRRHPDIYMPVEKELHFFGSDLKFRRPRPDEEKYYSYFNKAQNEKCIGEASVWYLYSKRAAKEIKKFCSFAKIIIMLRNPVDMLYSLHSQFIFNGWEDIIDFKSALDAEKYRRRGINIPRSPVFIEAYFYREVASFTTQVKRYFDVFDREDIIIIIFDNLKEDTSGIYRETLRFLGVNPGFQLDFPIVNPHKRVRSSVLREFLKGPPEVARKIGKLLIPKQSLRLKLKNGLNQFNTNYKSREPMKPEIRRQLQAEFKPEIEKLSELIDMDLTYWCR